MTQPPWICFAVLCWTSVPACEPAQKNPSHERRIEIVSLVNGEKMSGGRIKISRYGRGPSQDVWEASYQSGQAGPILPDARYQLTYYTPGEEYSFAPNWMDFHCLDGKYEVTLRVSPTRAEQEILIGSEFAGYELWLEIMPILNGFPRGWFDCSSERVQVGSAGRAMPVAYGAGARLAAFARLSRGGDGRIELALARAFWTSEPGASVRMEVRETQVEIPLRPIPFARALQISYYAPRAPISPDGDMHVPWLEVDGHLTLEAPPQTASVLLRGLPVGDYWLQLYDKESRLVSEEKIVVHSVAGMNAR